METLLLTVALCALTFAMGFLTGRRAPQPRSMQRFLISGPEADLARARIANVRKGLHPDAGLSPSVVSPEKSGRQARGRRSK